MSLDLGPKSPVFDTLLDLCPWAREPWAARSELIAGKAWNVNYINQGGNPATTDWLKAFFPRRAQATLDLLREEGEAYTDWARAVAGLAREVFADPRVAEARPGTPMRPVKGGALVNSSATVEGYAPGQFLADFLLLTQSSLRGMEVSDPLDLSGRGFPVGFEVAGRFAAPLRAQGCQFGVEGVGH